VRDIDPITRDVFQHQLSGIADEMSTALRRAAYSSIIWDMWDYSVALFVPNGDMIAQADTIPAQLGIMSTALRYMFREFPLEVWKPGDVLVCNDPYRGCTHTMDICLFSPVFHDDEIVAITSTIAHHLDIGGRLPGSGGPDNEEVFAEGLIFPPLKLLEEGVPNDTAFRIMRANVRLPDYVEGDLRAQIAGCRTGERRVAMLAERYGHVQFAELTTACLDYTETYARRAIAALPDGSAEAQILVEDDVSSLEPFLLHAKVTIKGDEIEVDVTGSGDQRPFSLNNPECSTLSMSHYAVKCLTTPTLAQNQGCIRPITVKMRKGSILDPHRPAAVATRHHTQQALADVVLKAMVPLCPELSAAGSQVSFSAFVLGGHDDRVETRGEDGKQPYYVVSDIVGGGMGASATHDGLTAVDTHGGNCSIISAEVVETISPLRVLRTELVPNSGGTGRHRGGLGVLRDFELLTERGMLIGDSQQQRDETAPWGVEGGGPGGKAAFVMNPGTDHEEVMLARIPSRVMKRGEVLRVVGSGGGGWGDASERDAQLAALDLQEGYITADAAE
jgi:N-methylhydantoinase B